MFCIHCGKEIPDKSVFCCFCGKTIFNEETSSQSTQKNVPFEPSHKTDHVNPDEGKTTFQSGTKKLLLIGWAITAVALLAIVAILLFPKIAGLTKSSEVKNVEALIYTFEADENISEENIIAAKNAYNDLSAEGKSKVSNYNALIDAEKTYAIKKVETLISSIGADDRISEESIVAAENAYNDLSAEDRSKVRNYNVLIDAKQVLSKARQDEAVKNVETLISAIGTIDKNSEERIIAAENAYNALPSEDKNKVNNYGNLVYSRKAYENLLKEIPLTIYNIEDYLTLEIEYGNQRRSNMNGFVEDHADVYISTYPVVSATFNNVIIDAEITIPNGWYVDGYSVRSDKRSSIIPLNIRLPYDGIHDESYTISQVILLGGYGIGSLHSGWSYKILSVSGTVKLN